MSVRENKSKTLETGMGNEVSHSAGIKQSVGGSGHAGQFHRVLLESEYDVPEYLKPDRSPTESLKSDRSSADSPPAAEVRKTSNTEDLSRVEDAVEDETVNQETETLNLGNSADDNSLIEECKALITEAADRAVQRSLSRSLSRNAQTEQVTDIDEIGINQTIEDITEQTKSATTLQALPVTSSTSADTSSDKEVSESDVKIKDSKTEKLAKEAGKVNKVDHNYALKCGIIDIPADVKDNPDKKKRQKRKANENVFEREVIESVKEHFKKEENLKSENSTLQKKSSKGNRFAKMFKFSKRKTSGDGGMLENKTTNEIVDVSTVERDIQNIQEFHKDISATGQYSDVIQEENAKDAAKLKRLNSLDSGIVVEKVNEKPSVTVETVEYAVVQKKKLKDLSMDMEDKKGSNLKDENIEENKTFANEKDGDRVKERTVFKEPFYMNGEKTDEDFVIINERAIDVQGLMDIEKTNGREINSEAQIDQGEMGDVEETGRIDDERKSNVSSDSGTSSGSKVILRSDVTTKPEKANLKKKSWSFQIGSKKNQVDCQDFAESASVDHKVSPTRVKKSKWGFGKFSFRKSSDDVTASTPNLHKAGIPEENDDFQVNDLKDSKKKSKAKKLKTKKDKKSSHRKSSPLETRSQSLMDIMTGEASNQSKRRSIVEDDLELPQTDAFEGVTLSDLSQDEDNEVSTDPNGKPKKEKRDVINKIDKQVNVIAQHVVDNSNTAEQEQISTATKPELFNIPEDEVLTAKVSDAILGTNEVQQDDAISAEMNKDVTVGIKQISVDRVVPLNVSLSNDGQGVEDEYVNIVKDSSKQTQSSVNSIDEYCTKLVDQTYAQVVKCKTKQGQEVNIDTEMNKTEVIESKELEDLEKEILPTMIENEKIPIENSFVKENSGADKDVFEAKSNVNAFSNMIYSDEEFQASIPKIKTLTDSKAVNTYDDSDAYVQLQQIVQDMSDRELTVEIEKEQNNETDIDRKAGEALKEELTPGANVAEMEEVVEKSTSLEQERTQFNKDSTSDQSVSNDTVPPNEESIKMICDLKLENETNNNNTVIVGALPTEAVTVVEELLEKGSDQKLESVWSKDFVEKGSDPKLESIGPKEIVVPDSAKPEVNVKIPNDSCKATEQLQNVSPKGKETSEVMTHVSEITFPVNAYRLEANEYKAKPKSGVTILKDVGVQVPDIYMPLDIEKDFGFKTSRALCVSVGVQVTGEKLDVGHVVVELQSDIDDKDKTAAQPAYF